MTLTTISYGGGVQSTALVVLAGEAQPALFNVDDYNSIGEDGCDEGVCFRMRTLLDAIIDCLEAGQPITVFIFDQPCAHPHYAPSTSYRHGCRCHRCRTDRNAKSDGQR